jgi:hypothetical protein
MKKYRVFKASAAWADVIFIFDINLKFSDIKFNLHTSYLIKDNYIGEFDFDENFLKLFNKKNINNLEYFYLYHYENDSTYIMKKEKSL